MKLMILANIVLLQQRVLRGLVQCLPALALLPALPALSQTGDSLPLLLFDPTPLVATNNSNPAPPSQQQDDVTTQAAPVELTDYLGARSERFPTLTSDALETEIQRYEQVLARLETAGGPYDPSLTQELLALGSLYQSAGDYPQALKLFERASHINRINQGLFNPGQIPIIERSIEAYLAQGDILAADSQQEYLFYLHRKIAGQRSIDLLPALKRYAEWNVFAFNPGLLAITTVETDDEGNALSTRLQADLRGLDEFRTRRLINAQSIYQSIIQILLSNYGLADPSVLDFEKQLAITNYLFATSYESAPQELGLGSFSYTSSQLPSDFATVSTSSLGYRQGRDALERRVEYMRSMTDISPVELARAQLELADWQLRFRKRSGALDLYEATWQELRNTGTSATDIESLLDPAVPLEIPTFLKHPYTRNSLEVPRDIDLAYKGYIDVEYEMNRYGTIGGITVLGKSPETPDIIESRLLRKLRNAQFRPRFGPEGIRNEERLRLRYHYTY